MKKAILVIDVISMPDGCPECNFCSCDGDECLLLSKDIPEKVYLENKRLSECPLRELPDRKPLSPLWSNARETYQNGWNDCLDKILGN